MSVTMQDVATRAGVSLKTVSRVVNGEHGVNSATRARVWQVIVDMGYVPHASARQLASGRTNVLGLVLPHINSAYSNVILAGILEHSNRLGYHVLVHPDYTYTGGSLSIVDLFLARQIDGIIFGAHAWERDRELLDELVSVGAPVTLIQPDLPLDYTSDIPMVAITDRDGAFEATDYLLDLGHRHIGFISCELSLDYGRERLRGYEEALAERGVKSSVSLIYEGDGEYADGFRGAQVLLDLDPRPTAIFASADQSALGVMQAVFQRGLRIPDDVSLVGFDDVPLARQLFPPLTTVRQPLEEIARRAVEMTLNNLKENATRFRIEIVRTSLVVRESCKPIES